MDRERAFPTVVAEAKEQCVPWELAVLAVPSGSFVSICLNDLGRTRKSEPPAFARRAGGILIFSV